MPVWGASVRDARYLEFWGVRPIMGGQDLPDASVLATDPTALDTVDMTGATIDQVPFDQTLATLSGLTQVPADPLAGATGVMTDELGNHLRPERQPPDDEPPAHRSRSNLMAAKAQGA